MSAHLTLVLSIVFAVAVNARLAAARSASLLPSEILKHMDGERMFNKVGYEDYQRYLNEWPYTRDLEKLPPFAPNYEKQIIFDKPMNHLDEQVNSVEEEPEPLPEPQAYSVGKPPSYKKSGSTYQMTICHFKICNIGRKRDVEHQLY